MDTQTVIYLNMREIHRGWKSQSAGIYGIYQHIWSIFLSNDDQYLKVVITSFIRDKLTFDFMKQHFNMHYNFLLLKDIYSVKDKLHVGFDPSTKSCHQKCSRSMCYEILPTLITDIFTSDFVAVI